MDVSNGIVTETSQVYDYGGRNESFGKRNSIDAPMSNDYAVPGSGSEDGLNIVQIPRLNQLDATAKI